MTAHNHSNTPDNQINFSRQPTRTVSRTLVSDYESTPSPKLQTLLESARKAAASGNKAECDRLWEEINARREERMGK